MTFAGFPKRAEQFFHQLAAEMSREWFAANKHVYEQRWVQPMTALLDAVRARIAPAYRTVGLAPPKLFRIHRDVRFSKDKAPYKTHIAGLISTGKGGSPTQQAAALYVSFGLEELTAAGLYAFDAAQVARWRKALLDPKAGKALDAILAGLPRRQPLGGIEVLTRVPRGFDPDHPRAALARHKGLVVSFPPLRRGALYSATLVDTLAERATVAAPLVTWLARHVA